MTINFKAIVFETDLEAILHAKNSGKGVAIRLRGRHMVIDRDVAHQFEAGGVEFAYLCDHKLPEGWGIVTVPVN